MEQPSASSAPENMRVSFESPGPSLLTISLIDGMNGNQPVDVEAMDLTQIDGLALGDLWTTARRTYRREGRTTATSAGKIARGVLDRYPELDPIFRGSACRDWLTYVAEQAEETGTSDGSEFGFGPLRDVAFGLARCVDLAFEGLGEPARRILAATDWLAAPQMALALARLVGNGFAAEAMERVASALTGSPLLVDQLRALAAMDLPTHVALAAILPRVHRPGMVEPDEDELQLSQVPKYAAFAEIGLKAAAERVRAIHAGEIPYAADKAFTLEESAVIAGLARIALERDEPWAAAVIDDLLRKVSFAPTKAKTVPSQSVAIALGHAIEAFPTPETIATLRAVVKDILHAGVKKKLQRNIRGAERGLGQRPEIALRLPLDQPISKTQLTTLARTLEASFLSPAAFPYEEWCTRLADRREVKGLAGSLVWRLLYPSGGSTAILPVAGRGGVTLQDSAGKPIAAGSDHRVVLWHPLEATPEERTAWRDRLTALQIKQPFKQAFREHYCLPENEQDQTETAMFSGYAVSIRPLLGLARHEGWSTEYDGLTRTVGRRKLLLGLADRVFPGAEGWTTTGALSLTDIADVPVPLQDLPPVTLSEILRSVDLMISLSGFAVGPTEEDDAEGPLRRMHLQRLSEGPVGPMVEMRRQALERVLARQEGLPEFAFDTRHLRIGPYAIHLATGRITRDGEPITLDGPEVPAIFALPWLPYDEKLLEIVTLNTLIAAARWRAEAAGARG